MIASLLWRIGLVGLAWALAGCGKASPPGRPIGHPLPPSALAAQCEPGKSGGRFVMAAATSPKTFNPLVAADAASDGVIRLLNASLINLNQVSQEPGPGLAESWSVAADQKTWTLKLRQGVRWSDGQPLTAEDVLFTWNELMYNPELNRNTFDLFRIGGKRFEVSAVDPFTVRVVTPEVYAPFLEFFGGMPILPKHALERAVAEKRFAAAYGIHTPAQNIVGAGPYRLREVQAGKYTLLERNPEYWVADKQGTRLPYFDEVMVQVGGGPGTEAVLFLNGKSDVYEAVRPEDLDQFKQASAGGRFGIVELGVGAERDFLWFNQNTRTNHAGKPIVDPIKLGWFRNKQFRQAIACAIDRQRMVSQLYHDRAQPIYGFISGENQRWNNPNVAQFGFDPARARALLAQIGMLDRDGDGVLKDAEGTPVEILLVSNTGNPAREKAALMIQEDLKKVGVKLIYQGISFNALLERINKTFDYECALMGLGGGGGDPAAQRNVLKSSEELHQWFPFQETPSTEWEARIDQLMDAQMRTLDFGQRKREFDEVQSILAEEMPMIYTVSPFCYAAIRSEVGNVRPSVLTPYRVTWNIEELYFKK